MFILCSDSETSRAGKRLLEQALIALSMLFLACGSRFSGSRQGNTWLSLALLQLGLFGLCFAIHPMVKAG